MDVLALLYQPILTSDLIYDLVSDAKSLHELLRQILCQHGAYHQKRKVFTPLNEIDFIATATTPSAPGRHLLKPLWAEYTLKKYEYVFAFIYAF